MNSDPRRWVFELAVAVVVVALLIWSGSAVETAGHHAKWSGDCLEYPGGHLPTRIRTCCSILLPKVCPILLLEDHLHRVSWAPLWGAIISVPLAFSFGLQPDSEAGSLCWTYHHYGRPHRSPPSSMASCSFASQAPGAFAGLLTMSPVFGRHGEQNVHRSH